MVRADAAKFGRISPTRTLRLGHLNGRVGEGACEPSIIKPCLSG